MTLACETYRGVLKGIFKQLNLDFCPKQDLIFFLPDVDKQFRIFLKPKRCNHVYCIYSLRFCTYSLSSIWYNFNQHVLTHAFLFDAFIRLFTSNEVQLPSSSHFKFLRVKFQSNGVKFDSNESLE